MGNKSWDLLHPQMARLLSLYLLTERSASSTPVMPSVKAMFFR